MLNSRRRPSGVANIRPPLHPISATAMLAAALPVAAGLGIDRVLVTCAPSNLASAGVIERNGGVLDSQDEHCRRYWISTG